MNPAATTSTFTLSGLAAGVKEKGPLDGLAATEGSMDDVVQNERLRWQVPEQWRFVGAVVEDASIDLMGENPWRHPWQSMDCQVELPDPMHAGQSHTLRIYSIDGKSGAVAFAAGEFSNGVWGFYLPRDSSHFRTIDSVFMRVLRKMLRGR